MIFVALPMKLISAKTIPNSQLIRVLTGKDCFNLHHHYYYATISDSNNKDKSTEGYNHLQRTHIDKLWPSDAKYPTPYDIFGVNRATSFRDINKNDLKSKYHKYVKLYHPDLSRNINIRTSKNKNTNGFLTTEQKLSRFKLILQAYAILIDPHKKNIFDAGLSNWNIDINNNGNRPHEQPTSYTNYYSNEANAYWNSGTWEDAQNFKNSTFSPQTEEFNKRSLIYFVLGLLTIVQGTIFLSKLQSNVIEKNFDENINSEDLQDSLLECYHNYGLNDDKISRIKRFLWFRTWSLHRAKHHGVPNSISNDNHKADSFNFDQEMKKNEELIESIIKTKE